ncbi:MAG: ABC transporter ATP-binding protein [Phycisphaerae bacterium]
MSKWWMIKTRRGKLDLEASGAIWTRFAHYTLRHRWPLLGALGAAFGAMFMQLAAPWPIKVIFDYILSDKMAGSRLGGALSAVSSGPMSALAWVCGAVLFIAILDAIFCHYRDVTLAQVGQRIVGKIRRDLFAHIQTLPPSALEHRRTGDLLTRLTGDIRMLRQMLVDTVIMSGQALLTITAMVAVMFWFNPTLALLGVTTVPITIGMGWRISKKIRKATKSQREKESVVASIAHDVFGAMPVVQAFNREAVEQKRFSSENRSSVRAGVRATRLQSKLFRVVAISSAAATCAILFVGVRSVLRGAMTAGDLLVFISYLRALNKPIRHIAKAASQVAKATACGQRVAEVFAMEPAVCDADGSHELTDVRGEVRFQNVSFAYNETKSALSDVSFHIRPGRRVAVVGHTGAGKSTLAKLLLRFHDPDEGAVMVDGQDVREVTMASLRRSIGWVHQETVLFGMSVAENIALAQPDADDEAVVAVARRVHAHEFIKTLPKRYDTVLGQGGSTLSGGQRQRIALARAMLKHPPILLLDEPATGLDAVSRHLVEKAWMSPENTATTIVICHRLRDMERFDAILVLKSGRLCEQGTHAELIAGEGEYAGMIRAGGQHGPEAEPAADTAPDPTREGSVTC